MLHEWDYAEYYDALGQMAPVLMKMAGSDWVKLPIGF